jgi:hypothetical protein
MKNNEQYITIMKQLWTNKGNNWNGLGMFGNNFGTFRGNIWTNNEKKESNGK